MEIKRSSLLKKYFKVTLSILLASVIIMGISLISFITNYWTESKVEMLHKNVSDVANMTEQIYYNNDIKMNERDSDILMCNVLDIATSAIDADVFVCDVNGRVILNKDTLNDKVSMNNDRIVSALDNIVLPKSFLDRIDSGRHYYLDKIKGYSEKRQIIVGSKIVHNGETIGYVFAIEPLVRGLKPFIMGMLKLFLFAALITIILTSSVAYGFTYSITKPLKDMSEMTKNYASGDFSKRLEVNSDDELAELAMGLNAMAQSLATLESSRRSFVANISHELKTPMTTISGFIDGILDGTIPQDKQEYYLGIVSDEVKRLSRLVVSMLNLSKIEAGKLNLKSENFDISNMFFNILLTFEQRIDKKHIEIEGLDKLQPIKIQADHDMIYQVVYNLVDNAVKFTDERGSIGISIAQESDRIIAGIRNTGAGIPPDEVNMIFERFYKVDKSRSQDVKGAGLGLYLAKSIVEMHGGQIAARSKLGEYTEFIFWIPKLR